jgi:predicted phosphodiesterase
VFANAGQDCCARSRILVERDAYDDFMQALERAVEGVTIHVSHGHELGSPAPARLLERYAADVIVYGHTHRQLVTQAHGRLAVNPGAAGPRRFDLKPSVARLTIDGGMPTVELVALKS